MATRKSAKGLNDFQNEMSDIYIQSLDFEFTPKVI